MTDHGYSPPEVMRRLDSHSTAISRKVEKDLFDLTIATEKARHDADIRELKDDFQDLRASYRKLVAVAVTEAFGLLIAIVLIAVQLALSFGAASGT